MPKFPDLAHAGVWRHAALGSTAHVAPTWQAGADVAKSAMNADAVGTAAVRQNSPSWSASDRASAGARLPATVLPPAVRRRAPARTPIGRPLLGLGQRVRLLGRPEREQLGQPREVLAQRLEHARRVERGRGVIDRVQPHRALAQRQHLGLPVQARDPGRVAAQQLRREVAERADHGRLDQLDLAQQIPWQFSISTGAGRGCRAACT